MLVSQKTSINLLTLSYAWNRTDVLDKYKQKGHFALYLLEALSRSDLPTFTYRGRKHPLQKNRVWYGDFEKDMKRFYAKNKSRILKGSENIKHKRLGEFNEKLNRLLETFGAFKPICNTVILCPNKFGVVGEGYGPLIGKTAFVIFTPDNKTNQTWLLIHELCHSLLLPIFQSVKIKKLIKETSPLMNKWSTEKFRKYYPKWEWMFEEYCIHAIEQYVTKSSIEQKMTWGMKRLPWFVKSWAGFQARLKHDDGLSVKDWVQEVLGTIT